MSINDDMENKLEALKEKRSLLAGHFDTNASRAQALVKKEVSEVERSDLEVFLERMNHFHSVDSDISAQIGEMLEIIGDAESRSKEEVTSETRHTDQLLQIHRVQRFVERLMFVDVENKPPSVQQDAQLHAESHHLHPPPERLPSPFLAQSVLSPGAPTYQPPVQARRSRLPVIEIPKFSGRDIREWNTFWERFESEVHTDSSLSGATKCTYLLSFLEDRAKDVVRGISPSAVNYDIIIDLLKKHFGNREKIRDAHIKAIETLQPPRNNYESLFKFYASYTSDVRALESFQFSSAGFEGIYVAKKIMNLLPIDIANEILRNTNARTPSLDELSSHFLAIIQRMEYLRDSKGITHPPDPGSVTSMPMSVQPKPRSFSRSQNKSCTFCGQSHNTLQCKMDIQSKFKIVSDQKLCFNCLGDHQASQCKSRYTCRACSAKHHSTLHEHFSTKSINSSTRPTAEATSCCIKGTLSDGLVVLPIKVDRGILKTALARAVWGDVTKTCHVFIDEGSELSFIKESYAESLGIKVQDRISLQVKGFGGSIVSKDFGVCQVNLLCANNDTVPLNLIVTDKIVDNINRTELLEAPELEELRQLALSDPLQLPSFPVDVLIGGNHKWDIQTEETRRLQCGLIAQSSRLGWLISGKLQSTRHLEAITSVATSDEDKIDPDLLDLPLREQVEKLICLDSLCLDEAEDTPDGYLEEFKTQIEFRDGQYFAPLTWKREHPPLPSNLAIAKKRLMSTTNRLLQQGLFNHYSKLIQEQLDLNFIEEVPGDPLNESDSHFLAHFYTMRDSETTPIRIVFAANAGQTSLNDCLEKGKCLLHDLPNLINLFRVNKFAFVADIAKAFLRIKLKECDRNYVKFLWWQDDKPFDKIKAYRYCSILFGPAGSPFTLGVVLLVHLAKYNSAVAKDLTKKLYCDNLLSGTMDSELVIPYYREARSIMSDADMNLRQWVTNHEELNKVITEEKTMSKSRVTGLLGLVWDSSSDTLSIAKRSLHVEDLTKRKVFKMAMTTFDPLGFLSPVTMPAKSFLSSLWSRDLDWDDILPPDLHTEWSDITREIESVTSEFKLFRYLDLDPDKPVDTATFSDASSQAAACVIYLKQGKRVRFVGSKVKIASKKVGQTIPRLELVAMLIAVKCTSKIKQCFSDVFTFGSAMYFTDSEIALYWLHSVKPLKQFVSRRVTEILASSTTDDWMHVSSEDNVADLATRRGCTAQLFLSSPWISGPDWLHSLQFTPWSPKTSQTPQVVSLAVEAEEDQLQPIPTSLVSLINWANVKSFKHLIGTLRCVLRARSLFKGEEVNDQTQAEVNREIEVEVIRATQAQFFADELQYLRTKGQGKRPHLVRALGLVLDEQDGLIRAAGRMQLAPVDREAKYPILVPRQSQLARLIIVHFHCNHLHSGVNQTVSALRSRYWIPAARQETLKVIRRCVPCKRVTGRPYLAPPPPPLPEFRLTGDRPFSAIGIDFSGHIFVKSKEGNCKTYLLLLTCCHTRAVSLELVKDMSAYSFLLAFRRHCSVFGVPAMIVCDNAPSFSRANDELNRLMATDDVNHHLGSNNIVFKHIPVKAAWMGGFYERFIGVCKSHLRKVVGKALLGYDELQTLIKEVQAVVNDRPITSLSSDINDPKPLTPSMLLGGHRITPLPTSSNLDDLNFGDRDDLLRLNTQRDQLQQRARQRFAAEYLPLLREQHCRRVSRRRFSEAIQVGDIVLIHDEDRPRLLWKLGRILELHRGQDRQVRSASVKTPLGITRRAISHLYPLEVPVPEPDCALEAVKERADKDDHADDPEGGDDAPDDVTPSSTRPRRQAAARALLHLREVESDDDDQQEL